MLDRWFDGVNCERRVRLWSLVSYYCPPFFRAKAEAPTTTMLPVAVLLSAALIHSVASAADRCAAGVWKRLGALNDLPFVPGYARTHFDPANIRSAQQEWLKYACPTQSFIYSCYYHEGHLESVLPKNYAENAEQRVFVAKDPQCLPFYPYNFLDVIRNRRLLFIGDSVAMQVFESLICALHKSTPVDTKGSLWGHSKSFSAHTCPFGDRNCYLRPGSAVSMHAAGVGVHMHHLEFFNNASFWGAIHELGMTKNDIVLFNIGLHYNNMTAYESDIGAFLESLSVVRAASSDNTPHILFLETTPQHFPTENGYYPSSYATDNIRRCGVARTANTSVADLQAKMRQLDWRNNIVNEFVAKFNAGSPFYHVKPNNLSVVKLAEGLYSQWDTHIVKGPLSVPTADCTHYCMPSGVFPYIHQMIYNSLLDELGLRDEPIPALHDFSKTPLIKGSGQACFLVRNGTRFSFHGAASFLGMGFDFGDVVTIPDDELNDLPYGGLI